MLTGYFARWTTDRSPSGAGNSSKWEEHLLLNDPRSGNAPATQKPPCDLVIRLRSSGQPDDVTIGVACVCTDNATSTTASLRRFAPEQDCLARLVLVTEERRPLKVGPTGEK
jgi:hypothetical protein